MAKEAKAAEAAESSAPPKKSKKLLIIVAAAVVLVLGLGGGAAYFLMSGGDHEGDDEEAVVEKKAEKKKDKGKETMPVYAPMDAFTVNLAPENGDQYLQLVLSVEVDDIKTGDKIKAYTPKLRNNIMLLLSSKKPSELLAREGKEKLAAEIRDMINETIDPSSKGKKDAPVKEVLFTSFIIQ